MAGVQIVVDTGWVAELGPLTDDMVERLCDSIAEDAQRLAPVLTGDLRNSIETLGVQDGVGRVGSDVDYAGYVELGTRKMAAQPYLKAAAMRARQL